MQHSGAACRLVRVVVYARISTSDNEQDPLTQLLPLREFVQAQGWQACGEFVDRAPATDLAHRTGCRGLLRMTVCYKTPCTSSMDTPSGVRRKEILKSGRMARSSMVNSTPAALSSLIAASRLSVRMP